MTTFNLQRATLWNRQQYRRAARMRGDAADYAFANFAIDLQRSLMGLSPQARPGWIALI